MYVLLVLDLAVGLDDFPGVEHPEQFWDQEIVRAPGPSL